MARFELSWKGGKGHRPKGEGLGFAFLLEPTRRRIADYLDRGGEVGLLFFEICNFAFFSGLYGENVADHISAVALEELHSLAAEHLKGCRDILHVESAERGRYVVLCGGMVQEGLPDLAMTFRLRLRGVVKGQVLKLTGRALDIQAGYASVVSNGSLESAVYTALCDAQQAMKGLLDGTKLSLLREFREIVELPRLGVVYQPIVDFRSGAIFGWESLARGPRDSHFRQPSVLFDFAEETSQVFGLERACRETAIACLGPIEPEQRLFLNIHPRTLVDPDFSPGETLKLLREHGLGPGNVVFEITERHSIRDFTLFHRTLEHYRGQGYLVAVDDVGTGYSGLQSIAEIRPDFIKIDMSLIRNIDTDPVKRALIETFVTFSDKIGCRIIAEGVETPTEMTSLIAMGVHFGQGYYLQRPGLPKPCIDAGVASRIAAHARSLSLRRRPYRPRCLAGETVARTCRCGHHRAMITETRWLFLLPPWRYARAMAWAPRIFVRPGHSLPPDILAHEETHLRRQTARGRWRWLALYLLSPSFRLAEEAAGYAAQVRTGGSLDGAARALSRWRLYFLFIDERQAREAIKRALEDEGSAL